MIFVFGSNLAGRHGKGAALHARQQHGAIYGQGVGLQGSSYAIPTKDHQIRTLPLETIQAYVDQFIHFARQHPELQFQVTRIGCGLAGYTDAQIAPLFSTAPANCQLPEGWRGTPPGFREFHSQPLDAASPEHPMKTFKLIVAGGRDFNDYARLSAELFALAEGELQAEQVSIVSGMARGADALGFHFAQQENVQCHEFPANWNQYGKGAGYRRNQQMAEFSDGLLAFWDGQSKGTAHMIRTMQALQKPVWIITY